MILLMYSNFDPDPEHRSRLAELSGFHVHVARSEDEAIAAASRAAIWVGHRFLRQAWPHRNLLRWLQISSGGLEPLLIPERLTGPWPEVITRCTLHSDVIAHHALALAWHQWRRLDEPPPYHKGALAADADFWPPMPKTAMVLGLGAIGGHLARMLTGLGMKVWGVSRRRPDDSVLSQCRLSVHDWLDRDQWRAHLRYTDLLFLCLPRPDDGVPFIGKAELAALPRHAVLVSIARPDTIDRAALVDALNGGRLAGAALDAALPLEQRSLWQAPRLYLSPKTGALHGHFQVRFQNFVEAQLSLFMNNKPLMETLRMHYKIT